MHLTIRSMASLDANEMERLYAQSAAHLRALGDDSEFRFGAEVYLRDGFGARPAFQGIVAAEEDRLAGYLLYTFGYDTDRAARQLFVVDLLVDETVRRRGIGRALMERAAAICREAGGSEMVWVVHARNRLAIDFYRRLGAVDLAGLGMMRLPV